MAAYDYDIGVIGGGAAGLTVASGASQLGAKTLLVERESVLGGDCLHYGCVPSKTLIKSAKVYHQMGRAEEFGLPAVTRSPVDFSQVSGRIRRVVDVIQKHDSVERFCGLGVKVAFGDAAFVDDHTIQLNGERVSAKQWVVATGTSPGVPPFEGLSETPYITNKELFYLDALPASLVVLGGGPIACEMAQAFARLGTSVVMVQRSGQVLSKEDADMAAVVQASLEADGVVVYTGATVEKCRKASTGSEVVFRDAQGVSRAVAGEKLLVALGREPNVTGLGLEAAGVEYTAKGIPVDGRMRTNQKHIYAAGDVTGRYQFTHAAGYEGGIIVSNAVFRLPRKANYTNLPWCTYTSPELASIGRNEKAAQAAGLDYEVVIEHFKDNDRALAEGDSQGCIKVILEKGKPIGAQIVGPRAGDLISEWVAIQNGGVKLSTLAGAIHPYPTLAEINKRAAGSYIGPKIFSEKVKKTLKFFFSYKGNACVLDE